MCCFITHIQIIWPCAVSKPGSGAAHSAKCENEISMMNNPMVQERKVGGGGIHEFEAEREKEIRTAIVRTKSRHEGSKTPVPPRPKKAEERLKRRSTHAIAAARVLYDFEASTSAELSVLEGETVRVTEMGNDGWWMVCKTTNSGVYGLVPASYLVVLSRPPSLPPPPLEDEIEENDDRPVSAVSVT